MCTTEDKEQSGGLHTGGAPLKHTPLNMGSTHVHLSRKTPLLHRQEKLVPKDSKDFRRIFFFYFTDPSSM